MLQQLLALSLVALGTATLACDGATDATQRASSCPAPERKFPRQAWAMSGGIDDVAVHCNTIYVAGGGTIGRRTGPLVSVSAQSGRQAGQLPELSGEIGEVTLAEPLVHATIDDGDGGWFVAGAFAFADGRRCPGVVHVRGDGRLDPKFCPQANGVVHAVARVGDTLFLGGAFTNIGGSARTYLAAVRIRDGRLLPWAPRLRPARFCPDRDEPGGLATSVTALVADSSAVFVGGFFSGVGGTRRPSVAAIHPRTGEVLAFDAHLRKQECGGPNVRALMLASGRVVVAGDESFSPFLRALDSTSGRSVRPRLPDLPVNTLAADRSTLYVGGTFGAAAFDLRTGARLPWRPRVTGEVCCYVPQRGIEAIMRVGDIVYLGGNFARAGGASREFLAAVDATSGNALAWNPRPNGPVLALGRSRDRVVLGGTLVSVNVVQRHGLVAIDGASGRLLPWAPKLTGGGAAALLVAGDRLYVGGNFKKIGLQRRGGLASFGLPSRRLQPWNPGGIGGEIYGVTALEEVGGRRVFVGGDFSRLAGEPRAGAAALDATSAELLDWDPNLRNGDDTVHVHAIERSTDTIYVGGEFEEVRGSEQVGVVSVDAETGSALDWNPAPANLGFVYAIAPVRSGVYLGGWFSEIGREQRRSVAFLEATSGRATSFNARLGGGSLDISAIVRAGRRVFIAGDFERVGGRLRAGVAAVDAASGRVLEWNQPPGDRARYYPDTLEIEGGALIVDGYIQGNGEQLVVHPLR